MEQRSFEYYAFISYSRKDEQWAKWIQHKLETYRFPVTLRKNNQDLPKKIFPIFRDKTDLVSGELWESLKHQMEESEYMIVICSPNSAQAEWVNNEVSYFRSLGRNDKIIPLIVDGDPHAADPEKECFCPVLRDSGEDELLGVSIRELGKKKALLRVISGMMHLRFDSLVKRDSVRRRRRAVLSAVAAVALAVWGGLTFRMTKDPVRSVTLAENAMAALQQENIYAAYDQGTESVNNLFKKTDYDPGVIALKSAAITKAFNEADPFPHQVFSMDFDTKNDQRWIGNSTDGSVFIMCNGTAAFTYETETGSLLGEYQVTESVKDKALITDLLGIDNDTDLYLRADDLRVQSLTDRKIGTLDGDTLTVACGEQTYSFQIEDVRKYCAVVNAEQTVAAVYDGKETVTVHCAEGDFNRTITISIQFIARMYLSPKGNLLVLFYRDAFDDQLKFLLYDITYGTEVTTLIGQETDSRTTDLFMLDCFTDYFYFYTPYHFSKYAYHDKTPTDTLGLIGSNNSTLYDVVLSKDCEVGFLKSSYGNPGQEQDRYIIFNAKSGESIFWEYAYFKNYRDNDKMLSLDPNMELLSYILEDKFAVYELRAGKEIYSVPGCGYQACSVSEDASRITVATAKNEIFLYQIEDGTVELRETPVPMALPSSEDLLFLGINGDLICATTRTGMKLYDLKTEDLVSETLESAIPVCSNISSSFLNGSLIILRENPTSSNTEYIYDVEKKAFIPLENQDSTNVYCAETGMLVSRKEYDIYEGTVENDVYVYQNGAFEKLYMFNTTDFPDYSFDPNGCYLILKKYREGSCDAVVLEAATGKEILNIPNHTVWISDGNIYDTSVRFVPVAIPKATFYTTKDITVLAKNKR